MEKINSKKNVALLATRTFSSFRFFFFHFIVRIFSPSSQSPSPSISLPFVRVWRLFIFSVNFFYFFFRHIERKCEIFSFRFYLNVAFGISSLTKEIPSENKIFSVTIVLLPSLPPYAQSIWTIANFLFAFILFLSFFFHFYLDSFGQNLRQCKINLCLLRNRILFWCVCGAYISVGVCVFCCVYKCLNKYSLLANH